MLDIQFDTSMDWLNEETFAPINKNIEITMEDLYSMTQKFVTSYNKMYNTYDIPVPMDIESSYIMDDAISVLIDDFEKLNINDTPIRPTLPVIHIDATVETNQEESTKSDVPENTRNCLVYDVEAGRYVKYDYYGEHFSTYIDTTPEHERPPRKKIRLL